MVVSMMSFSPNGEYFAHCGLGGSLKIWETAANTLKQEYASSSHLSATCTCLSWRPERKIGEHSGGSKRKKRKSETQIASAVSSSIDLLALGASSGSVLIFSVLKGDLQAQWDDGHNEQVNGVSWCQRDDVLYTCSSDSYIIEWNTVSGISKRKWKGDNGPIHAIKLCSSDTKLLSASHSIKLWDLMTKSVLQTFVGHATEVSRLLDVPLNTSGSKSDTSLYFLSTAHDDRHVHVWNSPNSLTLKGTKGIETALATLQLTDSPTMLDIKGPLEDGSYLFAVVTNCGEFLMFQQILNGRCKKPLKPKIKLQIASSNNEVPKSLIIMSSLFMSLEKLLIAYGSPLNPQFEKISYEELKPMNCLLRADPTVPLYKADESCSKVKTPIISADVKVLTPGHMVPLKPTSMSKKKRQRHTSIDMSVEDRLDVMGLSDKSKQPTLQTTSAAILLSQGLQSQDSKILNNVLQNSNITVIRNTIRKLPIPLIIPLVDELSKRLQGHAQANQSIIKWTKSLLTIHSSYLMTFPELVDKLSSLYQMMDARVTMFGRLSRLQGKLELLLAQVSNQSEVEEVSDIIEPLVTLQDESSDDEMQLTPGTEEKSYGWEDEDDSEVEGDGALGKPMEVNGEEEDDEPDGESEGMDDDEDGETDGEENGTDEDDDDDDDDGNTQ